MKAIMEAFEHADKVAEIKFEREVFEARVNLIAVVVGLVLLGYTLARFV